MKRNRLPFKLQFFAETSDPEGADGKTESTAEDAVKEGTEGAGGDTAAQDEGDVDKTDPKREQSKEDIAALVQEEVKKASMNPEEKAAYEKQQKEKELTEREDAISLRERRADAKELLTNSALPVEFRDMVMGKDTEETRKNVQSFKEKFDAAVQAQVEQRLKGKTPASGTGYTGSSEKQTLQAQVESYL